MDSLNVNRDNSVKSNPSKVKYKKAKDLKSKEPKDRVDLLKNPEEKELTVLYYLNGEDGDISRSCAENLLKLEETNKNDNINLAVQIARSPQENEINIPGFSPFNTSIDGNWSGVRRYKITPNNENNNYELSQYSNLDSQLNENPYYNAYMGELNWDSENLEKAKEYFNKSKHLIDYFNNPNPSKEEEDKFKKFNSDFSRISEPIQENVYNKSYQINSPVIEELPSDTQINTKEELEKFIEWGVKKYPARHYMLVFGSHGSGWGGLSGINSKEIADSVKNGLEKANSKTGRNDKIDATVFNSCLMGNMESAYEMKDISDVSLVSENLTYANKGGSWDHLIDKIGEDLNKGNNFDAKKFAKDMVDYFKNKEKIIEEEIPQFREFLRGFLTLSAIDNKKIKPLVKSWDSLIKSCKENKVSPQLFFKTIESSKDYGDEFADFARHIKDIGSITDSIRKADNIPQKVKEEVDKVRSALKDLLIAEQHKGKDMEGSSGLTVWAPDNAAEAKYWEPSYKNCVPSIVKDTMWDDFIDEAISNVPKEKVNQYQVASDKIDEIQKKINSKDIDENEYNKLNKELEEQNKIIEKLKDETSF